MKVGAHDYCAVKDIHLMVCLENDVESPCKTGLETIGLEGGLPDFAFV